MTVERVELPAPQEVKDIIATLENAGFNSWTVGGGVRDALAGERPQDWDVATAARPSDVQRLFRRTAAVGVEHGTVGVIPRSGRMYEVTTFRRDVETFGRKARVVFADTLEEDLARRDFTMNAVAWHPQTGELRDPHGGVEDLRQRLLRTVGEPSERFREDRLRVLRGLRFTGRFNLAIAESTWEAALASAPELHLLSAERVREELWKVLSGQLTPSRSLQLYGEAGVLRALYPELENIRSNSGGWWQETLRSVDAAPRDPIAVRLAALLRRIGAARAEGEGEETIALRSAAMARDLMRRLKSSNADSDAVTHLIAQYAVFPPRNADDAAVRRWIRRVGVDYVEDLFRLREAVCGGGADIADCLSTTGELRERVRGVLRANPPLSVGDLAIGGNDLRAAGIQPGPQYAAILSDLLERVTDEPSLNEREKLLDLLASVGDQ